MLRPKVAQACQSDAKRAHTVFITRREIIGIGGVLACREAPHGPNQGVPCDVRRWRWREASWASKCLQNS